MRKATAEQNPCTFFSIKQYLKMQNVALEASEGIEPPYKDLQSSA
jgi:hypothetical protein